MAQMSEEQRDAFLRKTRQGVLLSTNADGTASGLPIWFDWDGEALRMFCGAGSAKVDRIRRDPRISLLVTNDVDEPPEWVRFDGVAELASEEDARALAVDVLAPRYWGAENPDYAAIVDEWRTAPAESMVIIRLHPDRIRSSTG